MSQLSFQGKKVLLEFFLSLLICKIALLSRNSCWQSEGWFRIATTRNINWQRRGDHIPSGSFPPPPPILHSNNNAIRGFSIRYRQRMGGGRKGWLREPSPPPGSGREERRLDSFPPQKMVVSIPAVFSAPIIRSSRGGNAGAFPEKAW